MKNSLSRLLNTALRKTQRTFVLGATNRIEDREHSNEWCMQAFLIALHAMEFSAYYDDNDNPSWVLESSSHSMHRAPSYSRSIHIDPLNNEEVFETIPELKEMIKAALFSKITRVGNCALMANYVAHYLWSENNEDIDKISVVSLPGFDHVFVIVNDEWCLDPWAKEAHQLFHIRDFNTHMIETISYSIRQNELLAKEGRYNLESAEKMRNYFDEIQSALSIDNDFKIPTKAKVTIEQNKMPYPKMEAGQSDLTDHYAVSLFYAPLQEEFYAPWQKAQQLDYRKIDKSVRHAHQREMHPTLEKIKHKAG